MLINLRNALMAGKRLPYDAELEYLESTGTQWIDTVVSTGTNVSTMPTITGRYQFNPTGQSGNVGIFGHFYGSRSYTIAKLSSSVNQVVYRVGNATGYVRTTGLNDWYDFEFNPSQNIFTENGAPIVVGCNSLNVDGHIYLFANRDYQNSITYKAKCKLGKITIATYQGVLVRDFIPVRRGTVGYLYDRVTRRLFGNAGTGDFVLGPDVVPVEYIESHGTEWIDTGVVVGPTTRVELDAQYTSVGSAAYSTAYYLFAQHGGTNARLNIGQYTSAAHGFCFDITSANYQTNIPLDTDRHTFWIDSQTVSCGIDDATFSPSVSAFGSTTYSSALFARNNSGTINAFAKARMFRGKIWQSSTPVRSFRPIRVGSGSTWEGAMMDVLTRRIYRNAGTGAFAYGNDLKYPIPAE